MIKKIFSFLFLLNIFAISAQTPCSGGMAGSYPCNGITLQAYISSATMGAGEAHDSWGWTDVDGDGREYAVVALDNGTAFVDISDPVNPVYLARLNTHTGTSLWRDVKIYNNHAYIVSDANGNHGVQIFDLTRLRSLTGSPVKTYTKNHVDGRYTGVGSAHNIIINQDTGYLYILGSSLNSGAPRILDLSNATSPSVAGNISSTYGYCHDAQVVIYDGPDPDHQGKELLIGSFSSSDYVKILDVSDKSNISEISQVTYTSQSYTHQGWFTEDKRFFIVGDEVDEEDHGFNTRTLVFDMQDLDNPILYYTYYGPTLAIDHNGYVRGNRFYLANYAAGMRILKVDGLYDASPSMTEVNYFDTYPTSNTASFNGTWNVFPFFESGNLIATGFGNENISGDGGLFILKDPLYDNEDPVAICQAYTATLNAITGTVTINASDIDGGSTDNFGIVSSTIEGQTTFTCDDVGNTFNVTLTVEDDYGNKSSCVAVVTIEAETTTYLGGTSWSNGFPGLGSNAKISADYNTSSAGNNSIDACSCEIETGKTLTVTANKYININRDILVDGSLVIEHEGSLVQVDDTALVTNNGNITVEKITTVLADIDFTILGSPMTGETREGVYGNAALVRYHDTNLFVPNPDVENDYPLADNFADDNGDNWITHTGNLTVGEGYLVRPIPLGDTGGTYTSNYTLGTLNNGIVNFTAIFGVDQNDSPNILANPYASAVDAFEFVTDNAIVDAIYYWEHLSDPNNSYPGYSSANYSMGDISMYNLSGGTAAANAGSGSQPSNQYIPSGQGFGIKANAAGTVSFNNAMRLTGDNNGYRNSETAIDRLYIGVANNTYNLNSGTLIAFTELATDDFDRNYDAKRLATPVSLYSLMDEREFGIQGRSAFNEDHIIPLGFSTQVEEDQEYTISISAIEGILLEQATVYLKDNLLNTMTNLTETDYSFTSNEGHQMDRFELVFTEVVLGTPDVLQNIYIYPNPTQNIVSIVSPQTEITGVEVFDVRGRIVNTIEFNNQGNYQVDLANLESAMYFINIKTESGSIIKRVVKE